MKISKIINFYQQGLLSKKEMQIKLMGAEKEWHKQTKLSIKSS